MCGIVGFSGKYPVDKTKIRWLFDLNENRGFHSTGLFTVKNNKEKTQTLFKTVDRASEFIMKPEVDAALTGAISVVGHTRSATWGLVNQENAHPHQIGAITGVHNGFVITELLEKYNLPEKNYPVDSQILFAYLNAHGGDYRKLKDVEGAITTAYMIPNKFPTAINLYRREARELHFGRAPEGIYFSSERKPLEIIGCTNILEVPDLYLITLRDGEVLDSVLTDPPIIKTIPLGVGRSGWKLESNKAEWSQYEKLKPIESVYDYSTHNNRSNQKQLGYRYPPEQSKGFADNGNLEDIRGALIKHVQDDIKFITSTAPPYATEAYNYDKGDIDSCIVVIYLENSNKVGDGLAGFVIYDKKHPQIAGVTAINGIACLKYNWEQCGDDKVIVMADPIDGKYKWEYTIKPTKGRVLEVALQLPFPQEEKTKTPVIAGTTRDIATKGVNQMSTTNQLPLLPLIASRNGRIQEIEHLVPPTVSEADSEIHLRSAEGEILGGQFSTRKEDTNVSNAGDGNKRHGKTIPVLSREEVQTILMKENNTMTYKPKIKSFYSSAEYSRFMAIFGYYMGKYFIMPRIAHDAAVIKFAQQDKEGQSWAFGIYVLYLMEVFRDSYKINQRGLDENAVMIINAFCKLYKSGKINKPVTEYDKINQSTDLQIMALAAEQVQEEAQKKKNTTLGLQADLQLLGLGGLRRLPKMQQHPRMTMSPDPNNFYG